MSTHPTLSLDGKVALITGGSRGIGAATVRLFVQAGAKVVFNYQRAKPEAERLVQECGPDLCHGVQADLTGTASAEPLVRAVIERFGALDALVVNHGIWLSDDGDIDTMPDEQWRTTLAVNLDSAFAVVKHSVAYMKRQARGGHIVLVSSTSGQRGEAGHCDYAATKGALISMTKGLSTELAPHRIRVNCVAPGWVETDMTAGALSDTERRQKIFATIPLGRVATPNEIAAPIFVPLHSARWVHHRRDLQREWRRCAGGVGAKRCGPCNGFPIREQGKISLAKSLHFGWQSE